MRKLKDKQLDFIVANRVSGEEDAMGADTSRAVILDASGGEEELPLQEKLLLAGKILDKLAEMWQKGTLPYA
jgi:phosphopantothenoylcysteine decarboxylase/phosphopantothenate--cysteine ligase